MVGDEPDINQSLDSFHAHARTPKHRTRFQKLVVYELIWADLDAYRSLWSFLGKHDLVGELYWWNVPGDDPAQHIMLEPRLLHTQVSEGSWWRIVDVAPALEAREYAFGEPVEIRQQLSLTLQVEDDARLAPWNTGTFHLTAGADGKGSVRPAAPDEQAEVTLDIAALTNLWTGAASATQLSAWGMLAVADASVLARCALMFDMEKAPWCAEGY